MVASEEEAVAVGGVAVAEGGGADGATEEASSVDVVDSTPGEVSTI